MHTCCTRLRFVSFLCLMVISGCRDSLRDAGPATFVNPLIGTASTPQFSHGNTYPAVSMPMGMTAWTPQTGEWGWIYTYEATRIQGFRATHQPSPWMGDYGQFSFMPMTGRLRTDDAERASAFDHSEEESHPYYYKVRLKDYDVLAEMAPELRAAMLRFTFPATDSAYIVLDASAGIGQVEIFPEQRTLRGFTRVNSGGVPDNFACYFVAVFDQPFAAFGTWTHTEIQAGSDQEAGDDVGAYLRFEAGQRTVVNVRVGPSFISTDQAKINLDREIGNKNFLQVQATAEDQWNDRLGTIRIEGATEAQQTTFYTAMYRTQLFPRIFHEPGKDDLPIHYSPYDGQIHPGVMYVDNGFWDTFRAQFPLLTLLYPDLNAEIIRGLVNAYLEGDWFPKWTSPGYRDVMIGTHTASVIADAYGKGIRDFNIQTAYEGMVKDAMAPPMPGGRGRTGIESYTRLGYVPSDKVHEATARTLEFAYGDFCVGKMAQALGKEQDAAYFFRRANHFRNVFDPEVGFMRGRLADGNWRPDFSPTEWGGPFTEGSAWHYTWSVMHDPQSLIALMGGEAAFAAKIDELFASQPKFEVGSYGREIHEMTEMVAGNMGQYAHGNQPVHHLIYLYNYARQPWKTQKWVREVMDRLYGPGPDGLCGDEDNGQMSAWYIFSAMGFYPVSPGVPQYVIGSPLFPKTTLNLPNGRTFEVVAKENNSKNRYIQSARLNGKTYDRNWISHQDIAAGGKLEFVMGAEPNPAWGSAPESVPYSLSAEFTWDHLRSQQPATPAYRETVATPVMENAALHFRGVQRVSIACATPSANIRYTLDGSLPDEFSPLYTAPIALTHSATLRAIAFKPGMYTSDRVSFRFMQLSNDFPIRHSAAWSDSYQGGGAFALIDGVRGSRDFRDGTWQGFRGTDLTVEIDMQAVRPLSRISAGFLQNQGAWIFFPEAVSFALSADGKKWREAASFSVEIEPGKQGSELKELEKLLENEQARYVRISIRHPKTAPEWHEGAGGKTWLFMDEITLE